LQRGFAALQKGDIATANDCCRQVLTTNSRVPQAHFLVGLIGLETDNRKIAASAFLTVTQLDPNHVAAWAHLAKIFAELGYTLRADKALAKAESQSTDNPTIQNVIGAVCTLLGEHEKALHWYEKAYINEPKNPSYGVNLANAQSFVGRTQDAARTIDQVLNVNRDNPQAHWILANLSKAKSDAHARKLDELADRHKEKPHAVSFFSYGAGKIYEDVENWDRAFMAFERGAKARRAVTDYDEGEEERLFKALSEIYSTDWINEGPSSAVASDAPIFIIGQPRTGTTLIERIITSHSKVGSAGELQQFYLSMRRLTKIPTPARVSAELVTAASRLNPSQLGNTYMEATLKHARANPHFVDKMPVNYLYAPLIAKSLPNAKIIHITRNPMDSCFSSFKQLFADAYPHSYELGEMARHHIRYKTLMDKWRSILGDRLYEIAYEDTVENLEPNARNLISFLGLDWESDCLEFHKQKGAVSTASAVQVREPAHTRSVGRWRRYKEQLEPVAQILSNAGLSIDMSS